MTKKQMRQKIIDIGGYSLVANWCGVTRQAVRAWTRFKLRHCVLIFKGSQGRVFPGELRDDVCWSHSTAFNAVDQISVEIKLDSKQIMKSDY